MLWIYLFQKNPFTSIYICVYNKYTANALCMLHFNIFVFVEIIFIHTFTKYIHEYNSYIYTYT